MSWKSNFFLSFNSKSDSESDFLESLHIKWHVSSLFCFNLDDYGLQLMEIKNPVSQNIRIKHLQYRNVDRGKGDTNQWS